MNTLNYVDTSKSLTVGRCKISKDINLEAHYHKQTEFVYVINGSLSVFLDGKENEIKKDQFAVIRSLDIHSFSMNNPDTTVFLLILPDVLSLNLNNVNIASRTFTQGNSDIKKIVKLYKHFKALSDKYMLIYYQMFFEAIKDLYNNSKNDDSKENEIINFINNNFTKNLSLSSVAFSCNTNRSYVSRATNDFYAISFTQYINRLRISSFLDLYMKNENNLTIEELALKVGFNNIRTFYRAFEKELNCTPSEYLGLKK